MSQLITLESVQSAKSDLEQDLDNLRTSNNYHGSSDKTLEEVLELSEAHIILTELERLLLVHKQVKEIETIKTVLSIDQLLAYYADCKIVNVNDQSIEFSLHEIITNAYNNGLNYKKKKQ